MSFKVVVIGRPNVGKSTLFNRLTGKKRALVDDTPGVTRDRREGEASLGDLAFTIMDTAGLENVRSRSDSLEARMRAQTEKAVEQADICLMLVDVRVGILPLDRHFARWLHTTRKPVILLANKCEGMKGDAGVLDAHSLGLGEPVPFSAEHGTGTSTLYERLRACALEADFVRSGEAGDESLSADSLDDSATPSGEDRETPLRIAIVGRPNAGKSTLVNELIGEERMLTGAQAGITRDSIGVEWEWEGRRFRLFDTAGIRKRARVNEKLEKLSVADALRAIRFSEVVIFLVDATHPLEKQDLHIVDLVEREGRGLVVAVNKCDLVESPHTLIKDLRERLSRLLPRVRGVPVVAISALTGKNTGHLIPEVMNVYQLWNSRVPTARLNRWLEDALSRHPPPAIRGRRISLKYISQIKTRPPTFAVFSSRAQEIPESYKRYLVNSIREAFNMPAVPIRLLMRKGQNPYGH